jgi:acetyl-CoA C-acetyltransferase
MACDSHQHDVYLVDGCRTPIGCFLGSLKSQTAPQLGSVVLNALLTRTGVDPAAIDEVIMGCVLPAGIGQAPARQAMRGAGIPDGTGATTINKVCGSGLKAVMLAAQAIQTHDANLVLAGGMEAMSQTPYVLPNAREGFRMGHQQAIDSLIHDGLWDPYNNFHMGTAAEQCVAKYQFSKADQDAFARTSYERALAAWAAGSFAAEVVPVSIAQRKGDPVVVAQDEEPFKADLAKLDGLKPAFLKDGGTVTAGNASKINDGAAALLVASAQGLQAHGLTPKAKIVAYATHSQAPEWFTTAPVGAIQKVLAKAGLTTADIDRYEINEAFAAVTMAALHDLSLPHDRVNVRGGAVALGHPIGASGARILVTLLHQLEQDGLKRGLATLCIGGGEAVAMVIERV